jgi:thermostable 8-oxoguanine DNA glycosylase
MLADPTLLAHERLLQAVRAVHPAHLEELARGKNTSRYEQADFIWEALLLSMSTMGNSRGVTLVRNEEYHRRVRWDSLKKLPPENRAEVLTETLSAAKVRMPRVKARWLADNFDRIQAEGGPVEVKKQLEKKSGREQKIRFLSSFKGIGPKYARNMLMDVYHPDFRDSIAIDERIKKVSSALGLTFTKYEEGEKFYLSVAHAAGLVGWELDRLLYGHTAEVLASVPQPTEAGTADGTLAKSTVS